MKIFSLRCVLGATVLLTQMSTTALAELEPACVPNSPERRGEIGCSIVEDKPLPNIL